MQLSCMHWGGESSMGLDQKHQPDVTFSEVSRGANYFIVQAMISE